MIIAIPEYKNPVMKKAMTACRDINFVHTETLEEALDKLNAKVIDAVVAGIDITTRDMVLTCKAKLEKTHKYFSSCFVMKKDNKTVIVADAGVCKNPNVEMLRDIILETNETAKAVLEEEPRIAMLSFSTFGSGGADASIDKIKEAIELAKVEAPWLKIDGEMQLDVAIASEVAAKKAPESETAGMANVLVCPDLNSGNILYKSMERFGGFTAAGPILQGFDGLVSDLSRGSVAKDVVLVFQMLSKIKEYNASK